MDVGDHGPVRTVQSRLLGTASCPRSARRADRPGRGWAWGVILAGYGAGAILGGLAVLGRRPAHPLTVATVALFGWAAPSACLAAGLPTIGVTAGAVAAGIGASVFNALWTTTLQRHIRGDALATVNSYVTRCCRRRRAGRLLDAGHRGTGP